MDEQGKPGRAHGEDFVPGMTNSANYSCNRIGPPGFANGEHKPIAARSPAISLAPSYALG
jgi:hypothetical protein